MPLPHPTDQSDASTLPDPELNPLLNPLLAAHMGRWAEVYFTNPPEKREQAVAELLRELENLAPTEPASLQNVPDNSAAQPTENTKSPSSSAARLEAAVTCGSCAYDNSAEQRFCGMCGTPLHGLPEIAASQGAASRIAVSQGAVSQSAVSQSAVSQAVEDAPTRGASWSEYSPGDNSIADSTGPAVRSMEVASVCDDRELSWLRPERDFPVFATESEPSSSSYRIYVGAAVIVLLIVVGYMAWRGTEALSGTAPSQSAASQSTASQSAASQSAASQVASPQAEPARSSPPAEPAPAPSAQPTAAATAEPASAPLAVPPSAPRAVRSQPEATSQKEPTVKARPAPRIVSVAASSSAIVTDPSGAEDMATAEKYLNGGQGLPRDSGEAALWLWRAVGKGNLAATMTLSDLFLRGDVLAKNCGQARVLLDAAAKKGSKAAADRLRNLQAFGCE